MLISPFTPLFFDQRRTDGHDGRSEQVFSRADRIYIECLCAPEEVPSLVLESESGYRWAVGLTPWAINDETTVHFNYLCGLSEGRYCVILGDKRSRPFVVTDDEEALRYTSLIQYSMADNRQRADVVFNIAGTRHFFDWRVQGGFKDSDWSFGCETEQFTTQLGDICSLYALETTQKKFTLGTSEGVPIDFAEMLNRVLTCGFVYIDGVRYARKDASVPEVSQLYDGLNSFVCKQSLQRVAYLDPAVENANYAALRRVDDSTLRERDGEFANIN